MRATTTIHLHAPYPAVYVLAESEAATDGAAHTVGEYYFRALVRHLAEVTGARHAIVSRFLPPSRVCTFAYSSQGQIVDNIEYDVTGTPCEEVIQGGFCHHASGVRLKFPTTAPGIEGYLGIPLKASDGTVLGHLCILDPEGLPAEPRRLFNFQIYAARAAAELERLRPQSLGLKPSIAANTNRYRDLFDEAPIGYIFTDMESRYVGANRTAMRILGLTQADIDNSINGIGMVADTPAMRKTLETAAEAANSGVEHSGVWEMRRKSDSQRVFIELWTRPETNGQYIRTTFIDVTERVLMEQEQVRLRAQNSYLQEEIKSVHNFEEIIGANKGLLQVLNSVQRVAATDASVLIIGETGTGKELIARAIHSASPRADKPFIKINCAALPAGLVESELFGHERGAFSGAIQRRIGRFELANLGTIFLDEVGEMPLDVQIKLLRVLQEREFERVGGSQTIKTDVRVVAATNRDLVAAMNNGKFRSDLYYRLNVFPLTMPPLRARHDDIPLLAHFFVRKYAPRIGRRIEAIDADTIRRLCQYSWPGNIRELENVVERALILATSSVLTVDTDALPVSTPTPVPQLKPESDGEDLKSVQREHILSTLEKTKWVVEGERGAAQRLGMKPATLRHRMKKLGIVRDVEQIH